MASFACSLSVLSLAPKIVSIPPNKSARLVSSSLHPAGISFSSSKDSTANIFLFAIKKDHKSYNNFFFLNISAIIIETVIQKQIIIKKPYFKSEIIPR